jgi:hypothetical protein
MPEHSDGRFSSKSAIYWISEKTKSEPSISSQKGSEIEGSNWELNRLTSSQVRVQLMIDLFSKYNFCVLKTESFEMWIFLF